MTDTLLSATNPGFVLILFGIAAFFVRGMIPRALVTIGGPVLALTLLTIGPDAQSEPLASLSVANLNLVLYQLDQTNLLFGLAFLLVALIHSVYAFNAKDPLQDAASLVLAGAAIGAVFAGDLITMFVFWEIATFSSVMLIFSSKSMQSYKASMRYLGVQILSGVFLLAGTTFILTKFGSVIFDEFLYKGPLAWAGYKGAWLMVSALAIRAAFPLIHTWLQEGLSQSTHRGAMIISAFIPMLAIYAFLRMFPGDTTLIMIGAIMTVFPILFMVLQNDLKRVLGYVLNSQLGLMICAIGIGTPLALNGVSIYAFNAILFMSILFMALGAVSFRTGTHHASDLGGLYRTMPITAIFALIGTASLMALPLFSGFISTSLLMSEIAAKTSLLIWSMVIAGFVGVMLFGAFKLISSMFFGQDSGKRPEEAPFNMLLAMGMAAFFCLLVGIPGLGAGFLTSFLPDDAGTDAFLQDKLWALDTLLPHLQIIVFALFGFVALKRFGLYPKERTSITLDVDWIARRPVFYTLAWAGEIWKRAAPATIEQGQKLSRKVYDQIENAFSPKGQLSQGPLSSGMAIWTSVVLTVVMVFALFTGF